MVKRLIAELIIRGILREIPEEDVVKETETSADYTITLNGVIYSSGALTYASSSQVNDKTLQFEHGIWNNAAGTENKEAKKILFSPDLPETFEMTGTLSVSCDDSKVEGIGMAAPYLFTGFSDNGDISSTTNKVGIIVDVTTDWIKVFCTAFGINSSAIELSQPVSQSFTWKIQKTASGWYVEISNGVTTVSAEGSGTIDPEQFIAHYGEMLTSFPLNERATTTWILDSVTEL